MTRKDFEKIAAIIRETKTAANNYRHAMLAVEFASALAETNPRFDRARFIMACMPRHMVGTSKANVWERRARSADEQAAAYRRAAEYAR